MEILQGLLDNLTALLAAHPLAGEWYMAFVRFLFPALAVLILYRAVRSLLRIPHTPENWGQLSLPNGTSLPLTHWENILGRSKTADIYLNYPSISRQPAALCRGEDENWTLYDLGSKGRHGGEWGEGGVLRSCEAGGYHHFRGRAVDLPASDRGGAGGAGGEAPGGAPRRHLAVFPVADGVSGAGLSAAARGRRD